MDFECQKFGLTKEKPYEITCAILSLYLQKPEQIAFLSTLESISSDVYASNEPRNGLF